MLHECSTWGLEVHWMPRQEKFQRFLVKGWERGENEPLEYHRNIADIREIWTLIKPAREDLDFGGTNNELDKIRRLENETSWS